MSGGAAVRTYCRIFRTSLASQLEYRVNFISSFLFSLVPFGVNTLLWIAAAQGSEDMPLGTEDIVTYYFVTLIVSNVTTTVSVFRISDDIRLGDLNRHLLKPCSYALYQLMLDLPQRVVFIVLNAVPLTILYVLLQKHIALHPTGYNVIVFAALSAAGYLINFLIDFLIGLYSFYFSRVSSLYTSIRVLRNISAGTIFPLLLLPDSFFNLLNLLPFLHTSYIPTMFLMGHIPEEAACAGIFKAIGWVFLLSAACALLWRRGMRRYSAYEG